MRILPLLLAAALLSANPLTGVASSLAITPTGSGATGGTMTFGTVGTLDLSNGPAEPPRGGGWLP